MPRNIIAFLGPGLMLAATGVGAGDLAGGAFAGMNLGVAVLWAVILGAFFKYVITEGLARWQLATGTTLLEGSVLRLGRAVRWIFLGYLLIWSFGVSTALMSACGVAAQAILPWFDSPAEGKIWFGILHSLIGLALVWLGSFRLLERLMVILVSLMIVVVLVSAVIIGAEWGAVFQGIFLPRLPDHPDAVPWTLALIGGVGGTLTVLCYGYWIREENRSGVDDLRLCRIDLGVSYALMALFGMAMVMIASGMQLSGKGATLVIDLADRLGEEIHPTARIVFLAGTWAAVFSSLLGVWQAVPYLFSDFWNLQKNRKKLDPDRFEPHRVDTRGWTYRGYLIGLALVPMLGLRYDFQLVQKAYAVFGALVMPMIALILLILNSRSSWIGQTLRNRWWTMAVLAGILVFFGWIGLPKLMGVFGF